MNKMASYHDVLWQAFREIKDHDLSDEAVQLLLLELNMLQVTQLL